MRRLDIDLAALRHNLARVRYYAPGAKVLAMIKANAYGHGALVVAQALSEADGFGVADLDEALLLRRAGVEQTIVVMRGFCDATELRVCAEQRLAVVVHQTQQISLLENTRLNRPLQVWLKFETGMHRLGIPMALAQASYAALSRCSFVQQPLCVMSHFATADAVDPFAMARQWMVFDLGCRALPAAEHSLASSAAILRYPDTHGSWVRPGIMLYGVSPFSDTLGSAFDLQPVMTLQSRVIAIQDVPAGAAIGYGGSFVCPKAMRIGVVAWGYGDGYPRNAPTGTPLVIQGRRVALVGRVSMDLLTVDLSAAPEVDIGAMVTLWGKDLPVETVAQHVGTIPYELLCQAHIRSQGLGARNQAF